jgi:hypothetical protein
MASLSLGRDFRRERKTLDIVGVYSNIHKCSQAHLDFPGQAERLFEKGQTRSIDYTVEREGEGSHPALQNSL